MKTESTSPYLTVDEAAAYIRLSVKTIYNLKCSGKLRGHNAGGGKRGKLLFLKADLDNFIHGRVG